MSFCLYIEDTFIFKGFDPTAGRTDGALSVTPLSAYVSELGFHIPLVDGNVKATLQYLTGKVYPEFQMTDHILTSQHEILVRPNGDLTYINVSLSNKDDSRHEISVNSYPSGEGVVWIKTFADTCANICNVAITKHSKAKDAFEFIKEALYCKEGLLQMISRKDILNLLEKQHAQDNNA